MSLPTMIYLIDVVCGKWTGLATLSALFVIVMVCFKIAIILLPILDNLSDKESDDLVVLDKKLSKLYIVAYVIMGGMVLSNLIPARDTAYKMLAAYGVESIIANPEAQKLGGKSLQVLEKVMDDYLKETKGGE